MSSSYVQFSTPAVRKLVHNTVSVTATTGATADTILTPPTQPERRIVVLVQNQSSVTITLICNADITVTTGIQLVAGATWVFDNYNGTIRAFAPSTASVHIAYGSV